LHELNSFALGNRDPALASNLVTEIVSQPAIFVTFYMSLKRFSHSFKSFYL